MLHCSRLLHQDPPPQTHPAQAISYFIYYSKATVIYLQQPKAFSEMNQLTQGDTPFDGFYSSCQNFVMILQRKEANIMDGLKRNFSLVLGINLVLSGLEYESQGQMVDHCP